MLLEIDLHDRRSLTAHNALQTRSRVCPQAFFFFFFFFSFLSTHNVPKLESKRRAAPKKKMGERQTRGE